MCRLSLTFKIAPQSGQWLDLANIFSAWADTIADWTATHISFPSCKSKPNPFSAGVSSEARPSRKITFNRLVAVFRFDDHLQENTHGHSVRKSIVRIVCRFHALYHPSN